jgi:predicted amidohydrolase YtcJ
MRYAGLEDAVHSGIERGDDGTPTGVVFELDQWLRSRIGGDEPPDLGPVGEALARYGVTAVTDATAANGPGELGIVEAAQRSGALRQHVRMLGGADLPARSGGIVDIGQHKVMLVERNLPTFDDLVGTIRAAGDRGVAIHCVSRETLVLAASALAEAGGGPHRIEHASVAPPDLVRLVRAADVRVVTQPAFVVQHGDRYLSDVDARDQPWLYRVAGWTEAGVSLAAGSDAPFGPADPWVGIRSAVERRTDAGHPLGLAEQVSPERALGLYQSPLGDPGGPPRRVALGAPADLCVLALPWAAARHVLSSDMVLATVVAGELIWHRPVR